MFTHRYRYLYITLLAAFSFSITEFCEVYRYFEMDIHWYHAFATILAVSLFTWESSRLVENTVRQVSFLKKNKLFFLGVFFSVGNVLTTLSVVTVVYCIGHFLYGLNWQQIHNPIKLNLIYGFLINLLFHLINAIMLFFKEYKKQWEEMEELRKQSTQAHMQLIKSQINPHFLFNNLNVLSGMLIKDNPEANSFLEAFTYVYRYILNNHHKELVPLHSELEFIEPYTFLLKKRFDQGFLINVNIPEHYKLHYIVPAALQMLIENAFKHNVVSPSKPLSIDIHANGYETLIVRNNLQPRKAM